jgi:biopolymer transport protein ExbD
MGMAVGGSHGTVSEMNVVPQIDILLVLLVIFMVIPHSRGLRAEVPQPSTDARPVVLPEVVVIQVLSDGTLRIDQDPVNWDSLESRLEDVFKLRADRTAFIRGDRPVEFQTVAKVIDLMHTAGITSVGLLTSDLQSEMGH